MRKLVLQVLAVLFAVFPTVALAQAPKDGVYIGDEDIKAVLKHSADTHRTIPDNTLRVIDMGQYQLGVAVVARGAMKAGGAANAPGAGNAAPAAAANASTACGEKRPGATGPNGIFHDDTAESYVVISGAGTLITGGTIVNGKRSGPNDEVTTVLNGPSCGGTMVGYTSRRKGGRRHHHPGACAARLLSHPGSHHLSEHPAGSEKSSAARVRKSGAKAVSFGRCGAKFSEVLKSPALRAAAALMPIFAMRQPVGPPGQAALLPWQSFAICSENPDPETPIW